MVCGMHSFASVEDEGVLNQVLPRPYKAAIKGILERGEIDLVEPIKQRLQAFLD